MALFKRKPVGAPGEWYYCLRHGKVEEGPECPAKNRLGPYATPREAAHALETARRRTLEWENDPRWHGAEQEEGRQDGPGGTA